jgi:hypothetical protein
MSDAKASREHHELNNDKVDLKAAQIELVKLIVAPWTIVAADDKPLTRINVIRDLLTRLEFKGKDRQADLPNPDVVFSFHENAIRDGLLAK